jgi:hypothetical protein
MNNRSFIRVIVGVSVVLSVLCALNGAVKAENPFPVQNEKIFFDGAVRYDSSSSSSTHEIYCINPDGTHLLRMTSNTWDDRYPRVSPDRSRIAFVSNRRDEVVRVWVINADGTAPTRISDGWGSIPAWSPDSKNIAFYGNNDGKNGLYVAGVLDRKNKLIYEGVINTPVWSEDGIWIFFSTPHNGYFSVNTQTREVISVDKYTAVNPIASPDNTGYAYFNEEKELCIANNDGSGSKKIFGPLKATGDIWWITCQPGQFESSVADSYVGNWDSARTLSFVFIYGMPVFLVCFGIYWLVERRRERKRLESG